MKNLFMHFFLIVEISNILAEKNREKVIRMYFYLIFDFCPKFGTIIQRFLAKIPFKILDMVSAQLQLIITKKEDIRRIG